MDLEALLEHGSEAVGEQSDSKSHILIQWFFGLGVRRLGDFPVENEIERVLIYADLVCDEILLIVKEVFQELASLRLMISLSY